ncbi:hypothetical protein TrVE_jg10014 [Triparma verrucosa]|uniref:PCIF1 WW domain-containing protein n=1 Tax=Triparma verrucosa TaxID=1606542 RepID=A0A9W7KXD7_9STRA|nr:hypothetical protein TrVE_jg10014 [Triparma verrucosa]
MPTLVSERIAKYFGDEIYYGTLMSRDKVLDPLTNASLGYEYFCEFDDGDAEHISTSEAKELIDLYVEDKKEKMAKLEKRKKLNETQEVKKRTKQQTKANVQEVTPRSSSSTSTTTTKKPPTARSRVPSYMSKKTSLSKVPPPPPRNIVVESFPNQGRVAKLLSRPNKRSSPSPHEDEGVPQDQFKLTPNEGQDPPPSAAIPPKKKNKTIEDIRREKQHQAALLRSTSSSHPVSRPSSNGSRAPANLASIEAAAYTATSTWNSAASIGRDESLQRGKPLLSSTSSGINAEEHPYISYARQESITKDLLNPLYSHFQTSSSPTLNGSTLSPLSQTRVGTQKIKTTVQELVQNYIFFVHTYLKDEILGGDRVFPDLTGEGRRLIMEYVVRQLSENGRGVLGFKDKERRMLSQTVLSHISSFSSQMSKLTSDLQQKSPKWSDLTLSLKTKINPSDPDIIEVHLKYSDRTLSLHCYCSHFNLMYRKYSQTSSDTYHQCPLSRIFTVLGRYRIFWRLKVGAQASISSEVFLRMKEEFGVGHECYASPLNRSCKSFCSLFYDTDKYFGSVGSFWDYSAPDGGSFEVNPPFDPKSTQKCLEKMNQLLEDSDARGKAISFILVFTMEKGALKDYTVSFNMIGKKMSNRDYAREMYAPEGYKTDTPVFFTMGGQHSKNSQRFGDQGEIIGGSWEAPGPHIVAILQNRMGSVEWPVDKRKVDGLIGAFLTRPSIGLHRTVKTYADSVQLMQHVRALQTEEARNLGMKAKQAKAREWLLPPPGIPMMISIGAEPDPPAKQTTREWGGASKRVHEVDSEFHAWAHRVSLACNAEWQADKEKVFALCKARVAEVIRESDQEDPEVAWKEHDWENEPMPDMSSFIGEVGAAERLEKAKKKSHVGGISL